MKVSLVDMDIGKGRSRRRKPFPNLALMKLSAHHKKMGDDVSLNFLLEKSDIIYASCVFTWHSKRLTDVPPETHIGGSGLKLNRRLPDAVEHIMPDYTLYSGIDFSMGFTSRGCIRKCPWCNVPAQEGSIKHWADFREFLNPLHSKLLLLDNNVLADPEWRMTLSNLGDLAVEVDFNQGLDIRLVNEEVAWYLKRMNTKQLRFAFDDMIYEKSVRDGIKTLTNQGIASRKLSFYVLVGFGDDETVIDRMKLLSSLNVDVYPMIYKDESGKEPIRKLLYDGDIFWHGNRRNINKFLRIVGRLPE